MHLFQLSFALFLLLLALSCATETPADDDYVRIFGGFDGDTMVFPYQVGVKMRKMVDDHWFISECGGTIISENFIITAAHCVAQDSVTQAYDPIKAEDIFIYANSSNYKEYYRGAASADVKAVHMHPEMHPDADLKPGIRCGRIDIDVAILELKDPLVLGFGVRAIPLAKAGTKLQGGTEATILEYGPTRPDRPKGRLYSSVVSILPENECRKCFTHSTKMEKRICAGSERQPGHLLGQPGGSLVVNGVLEGVCSCSDNTNCPDLFVRLADDKIRAFIKEATGI